MFTTKVEFNGNSYVIDRNVIQYSELRILPKCNLVLFALTWSTFAGLITFMVDCFTSNTFLICKEWMIT